jgi:hypothetical protein
MNTPICTWIKRTDSLKSCFKSSKYNDHKEVLYIRYLYILETLEQRLPKACTAISSSALLIYPRAISSLNLVQNHTQHG